jgi:hypothetical protein
MHGRNKKCIQYFGWKREGKNHSEDLGVDGRIIVELILGEYGGKVWVRIGPVAGFCEHGNEPSGSISRIISRLPE